MANKVNSKINTIKLYYVFSFIGFFLITLTLLNNGYSQRDSITEDLDSQIDIKKKFIIYINLERTNSQLELSENNLVSNNLDKAFSHAYIIHTNIFPNIKSNLQALAPELSSKLEKLLTDLPIFLKDVKTKPIEEITQTIDEIRNTIYLLNSKIIGNNTLSDKNFLIQSSIQLLQDASNAISISNQSQDQEQKNLEYDNIKGILERSKYQINQIPSNEFDERENNQIMSMYSKVLQNWNQNNFNDLSSSITSLQSYLKELLNTNNLSKLPDEYQNYFSTIHTLLNNVIVEIRENNDYRQADKHAMSAYLDNYEYLEAPIEKNDPNMMVDIEVDMREDLRKLIKNKEKLEVIEPFITQIKTKLDNAKLILENDPSIVNNNNNNSISAEVISSGNNLANIEELSKGFGSFQGDRKEMGESTDPQKQGVRNDIDQIRLNLQKVLDLYKENKYDEALVVARSAYLDSYENIELPLRPIDPDFTLDMEIKFAELRNMIEQRSEYENIVKKIGEIQKGLDESERLVSGIGTIAPGIAFTSSFSIIFREGLESALIIGAIITYLEASRNERFKKHVYYGIILAASATALTWMIAEFFIELSGASRELIEAIAGISAVAVLFWVSFWVLNKIETKKWIEFVKSKVWKATTTGSVMVFVLLSFFTVYREGFETVLFYQAMLSYAKHMELFVILGMIIGLAVIIGVAVLVRKLGKKLPLRVLFGLTMGIGAYMSITFLGNAIREFQEVGYITTTHLFGIIPRLDVNLATMTGIHPTLETVVAQLILLSVYLVGSVYILVIQPRKKKLIESSRKSMSDFKK
ncbi:MAG: FTR1 family iron permease [Nitrososphaeraceae archaeon]|nr:FTR1 family iron permease [Nitrososphaeraceae archaeon]